MSPLTFIIFCPFVMAALLALVPRNYRFVMRLGALLATAVSMIAGLIMFLRYVAVPANPHAYQFEQFVPWVKTLGIGYHVGVDGINIGLILMAVIVAFAATCAGWEIREREKEFYILLLVMIGGILGAFASLDLFCLYFFHELALVPTFIMIGVWGRGKDRNYATFQITLYLSAGALIALAGLILLYLRSGANSFDIPALMEQVRTHPLSPASQNCIFGLLLLGFGILISLWPFHTWAPLGYGSAPAPAAMLHAGVLKKFGLYALIRVALPLLPEAAHHWANIIAWLALGNLLYCGLVALRQKDFNRLIGYSSVAHMGFVFLGIASLNIIGVTGAVLVMIAHGFLAALTFGLSGYLYQQTNCLDMDRLGGLLRRLPFLGTALIMALFAGCGLPGFLNFAGEISVFFGSWKPFPVVTALAVWAALVIGAVYMMRAIRDILHGPLPDRWMTVTESTNPWRKLPYLLLLACLLFFGFFPRYLANRIKPGAQAVLESVNPPPAASALALNTGARDAEPGH